MVKNVMLLVVVLLLFLSSFFTASSSENVIKPLFVGVNEIIERNETDDDLGNVAKKYIELGKNKGSVYIFGAKGGVHLPTEFDTGPGTYPSISDIHNGTITPSFSITISQLYTYPCLGTGGHAESIQLYEKGVLISSGSWTGYHCDWHNITLTPAVTLLAGHTYDYSIVTGSYPQIIHAHAFNVDDGTIICTEFVDVNGAKYTDQISALRLYYSSYGDGGSVGSDGNPPSVTSPSATPPVIPNDGKTTSFLSVQVTDDTAVDLVTIDLSPIGGPESYVLTCYGYTLFGCTISVTCAPGTYNLTVNARDIFGNANTSVSITVQVIETTPPSSITNLTSESGSAWINWTWTNPPEADFSHTMIYLNWNWKKNTSSPFYNATRLKPDTWYEISTQTVDIYGNINDTWISDLAKTLPFICVPPNIAWNMSISATNQVESVVVGMHPNATDGFDSAFDTFTPMPVYGKVIMILDDIYATSTKKTRCFDESVSWNLSVGVPAGQTTALSWDNLSNVSLTIVEGDNILLSGSQLGEGSHKLTVIANLEEYIEHCVNLNAGWNMVSLPMNPNNNSVQAIFGSIPTLATMPVKTWVSPLFITVEEIESKVGYWVFTPAATRICVTGKPITNTTLNLKAGWNMVGTFSMENVTIAEIPNQVSICPTVTWISPSFVETDVIEPGKCAWVFVTQDTVGAAGEGSLEAMKMGMVPASTIKSSTIQASSEEWNLTIAATNQLEPVTFGIDPNATDGYDLGHDVFTQTPIQGKVTLILDGIYANDINVNRMTWNISVGVPTGETTTLSWDSSQIPAEINLTLDSIDMKSQISLQLGEGSHSFVAIGRIATTKEYFDTNASVNPHPSISGTNNGTIKPSWNITVNSMYTYPCSGTGGHTEYAHFWNDSGTIAEAQWNGYTGDWQNLTFNNSFTLYANETYNYTIRTGSYPQMHHTNALLTENGWINCTEFVDVNGQKHENWIPAIKLWSD